jgi:hypothetical protein
VIVDAAAGAAQAQAQARAGDISQAGGREPGSGADLPAGERRTGAQGAGQAQQQGGRGAGLGGQLQAAGGGEVRALHLAQHGGQCARAQALLDAPQHLFLAVGLDHQQAGGIEERRLAGAVGTGIEAPATPSHPEERPVRPAALAAAAQQPQGEARGGGSWCSFVRAYTLDLMQATKRETALGQGLIDLRDIEAEDFVLG